MRKKKNFKANVRNVRKVRNVRNSSQPRSGKITSVASLAIWVRYVRTGVMPPIPLWIGELTSKQISSTTSNASSTLPKEGIR